MHNPLCIAVVGMDGIFPGAPDLDRFWQNIVDGADQSAPVPQHRWIAPAADRLRDFPEPDRTYSRHACLIDDFEFDPQAFRLDPDLTRHLDPVHQLTLTAGRRAIDSAIIAPVDPARVDTILAAIALPTDSASAFSRRILGTAIEQRLFPHDDTPVATVSTVQALASRADGLPAALLAAEMGFGGDTFTLDAACASSIYAVKLACDALIAHRADMVVTGGVSRPECLYTQTGFSQLRALSPSGRCAPFDRQADGLVVGEGVGILVLKRLDDAIAHGDTIHGVIRGIGLTNDMRGNLLAPECHGQIRAMRQAYRIADWLPSDVDLIECHGTGTRAGDTTETESLVELWRNWPVDGSCAIGSIKSMIGHLLTAAGAAGMIKTLLAMRHRTLPPSINYAAAPADSPLENSPFHVQTAPAVWSARKPGRPRRAAVSAFGFGGINAHILVEEWLPDENTTAVETKTPMSVGEKVAPLSPAPVAIVGMDLAVGAASGLDAFSRALFDGDSLIGMLPAGRWKGADATIRAALDGKKPKGAYMERIGVGVGEFQIPPNEIDAILPQQLLALKVGAGALQDAGLPLRQSRERMGVVFGIGFDFEATNFHLRWQLSTAMQAWPQQYGFNPGTDGADGLLERLRNQCGPPLTPPRVVGALGGIVASRAAREFRLGGPSFVVSADAASGAKALQVAVDLLQTNAADAMLVGVVDLAGDGRSVVRTDLLTPLSPTNTVRPLDARADGCLPGDGAVALVLKRLDHAKRDQDRIYAVIRGIGAAGGDPPDSGGVSEDAYGRSLSRCFHQAGIDTESVSYIETDGSAVPARDRAELNALAAFFGSRGRRDVADTIALGATSSFCGHTGAAHGLMALAKATLCLYHRKLPPLTGFERLPDALTEPLPFHLPLRSQPWYRDRQDGPRTACVATVTTDGGCSHVLLEEAQRVKLPAVPSGAPLLSDQRTPSLVVITGSNRREIDEQLARLERQIQEEAAIFATSAMARWMYANPPDSNHLRVVSLIVEPGQDPQEVIDAARRIIRSDGAAPPSRQVFFSPRPMAADAKIAMVYPGSGNHYLGMGRDLALNFPDIVETMDRSTARLKTQWRPWHLMPWRQDWENGWRADAVVRLAKDPLNMIFGQVVFGGLMTAILDRLAIRPDGIIGYSLGESAALFAHSIWADRGEMLDRMEATDLFTTQLAGPCQSLRRAWDIAPDNPSEWRVAVVNRPARMVRDVLKGMAGTRLLIVNTPDECVIGGLAPAVKTAIAALACQAVYLDGVVTVHCDAARPVAEAYRQLHHFATAPKTGLDVYSCSWARAYSVTPDNIADSIRKQAVDGFDFTQTIKQAYADGYRVFIEAGPRASCTRMIGRILQSEPHLAVSASHGSENELDALLRCLARLAAERVPLDLSELYKHVEDVVPATVDDRKTVSVTVGGAPLAPALPEMPVDAFRSAGSTTPVSPRSSPPQMHPSASPIVDASPVSGRTVASPHTQMAQLLEAARENIDATADAHRQFLDLSRELTRAYADAFDLQNTLLGQGAQPVVGNDPLAPAMASVPASPPGPPPAFDRRMCMEFAVGRVGRVLGPAFDGVDTHRVRVRLPDEPLMLVDRILSVEGEQLSMTSGRVATEHDVLPGAWYLDGERAPVCISVEAGQADLFLSAYLGIDHQVKGERAYRLLDAEVTFHRGLPRPGDTIRYDIAIDRFVRQGDTWMFFFRFEGTIDGQPLISMRDGCAGFFTEEEVTHSGGIILTDAEREPAAGKRPPDWWPPVPMARETYSDDQVDALRRGDLAGCFGPSFTGIGLADSLHLPDGRMRLIHRILDLDPAGGRYGVGSIRAEADIRPDDWFLTCHFVDDRVMPGTLMYECCAHTLRVFLQRMGWVTEKDGVCYEPVIGNAARLKCRGPVTPATRHVHYEIHISEIGYGPEPYVVADAHMSADGRPIVFFKDMSMKMTGIDRPAIEAVWQDRREPVADQESVQPLYDHASILAFATGNPSDAFGEPYRIFDSQRRIARLPGPPYCFMDRVIRVDPEPWSLAPGGWITARYDMSPEEWYFAADRSGVMPFCVLLEIALQPCGWLAAYAGSALRSQRDLKFRNLGGSAVLHRQVGPDTGTLTMRSRLTKVSEAADMIIENFDFEVLAGKEPVYTGDTYFGFFSAEALGQQKGLGADPMVAAMAPFAGSNEGSFALTAESPHTPDDAIGRSMRADGLKMPGKALLMIDRIDAYLADGGPHGLGYIRGTKIVDPQEWFFKAHFYQDPVCPGSLGLESFLQLLKTVAMKRWPQRAASHQFRLQTGARHAWSYRGQIIPDNAEVTVEATVSHVEEKPVPIIRADGLLTVDGLPIYKMDNFELALVPAIEQGGA